MVELTVTRTKEYFILKIPIKAVQEGKIKISPRVERAITQGLKAYKRGDFAGPFNAKQADAFLRTL